jgi:hypothetical protein
MLFTKGTPKSKGKAISIFNAKPKIRREFYSLNNRGYCVMSIQVLHGRNLRFYSQKNYYLQHPWVLAIKEYYIEVIIK